MAVRGVYTKEEEKALAEARELIGKTEYVGEEYRPGCYYPVSNREATRDLIRRFVDIYIGDDNPLWLSEDYARKTRWGRIIAPPFFQHCIAPGWGRSRELFIPASVGRMLSVNAGSKWQFFKPIYENDSFRVKDVIFNSIEDTTRLDGKGPHQFLITADRTYINQRDEVVCIATRRMANTILPPGNEEIEREDIPIESWDPGLAKWEYTKEEREAIDRTLEEEERRGANPRYWEDVVVGDQLRPVIHGPHPLHDQAIAYAMTGMSWSSRAVHKTFLGQPEEIKRVEDYFFIAITQTGKGVFGVQKDCMLGHLIANWMGDDGFLKRFDSGHRTFNPSGDVSWCRGKVIKKYVENGEHLVDLAVWIESIRGWIATTTTATVVLPSRSI